LAVCGFMDVSGWLLPDPTLYKYEIDSDDEDDSTNLIDSAKRIELSQIRAARRARHSPENFDTNLPSLLQQLKLLVAQVSVYRKSIPRFDDLLLQRRTAFHMQNSLQQGAQAVHQSARSSLESVASRSTSPARAKPSAFDSLAQRIFPDLATPSRSGSRGRSGQERSSGTSTPISMPILKQGVLPATQLSAGSDTPSRRKRRAFSPSPLRGAETTVEETQALAFREVDRGILTREVEIPKTPSSQTSQPSKGTIKDVNDVEDVQPTEPEVGPEDSSPKTGLRDDQKDSQDPQGKKTASVSHVLTNVIVLQEFLLELAALVQVRAGLFGEVQFV